MARAPQSPKSELLLEILTSAAVDAPAEGIVNDGLDDDSERSGRGPQVRETNESFATALDGE